MRYQAAEHVPIRLRRWVVERAPDGLWSAVRPAIHGETRPQLALTHARLAWHGTQTRGLDGVLKAVRFHGRDYLGHVVTHFAAERVRRENLQSVCGVLAAGGVKAVVVDEGPARRSILAVPATQREQVWSALRAGFARQAVYVQAEGRHQRPEVVDRIASTNTRAAALHIFRVLTTPQGSVLDAGSLGCELEFWEETAQPGAPSSGLDPVPAGTLLAPRRNRWVDHLKPGDLGTDVTTLRRTPVHSLRATARPHLLDLTEPVDAVYTWVNGDDPTWQHAKARAMGITVDSDLHPSALSDSRYTSHDELRYSMRSLEMYAGWLRHVYLVTDDQVPHWLDTSHPKVTVVSHRELFGDRGRLPTFNSHAIESQLHHIEGLSEHFLYLNDDVFLGRPVAPELFFSSNGIAHFFPSTAKLDLGPPREGEAPVMSAAKNNRKLIDDVFGRVVTNKLKHGPHALRRQVLQEMEERFAHEFKRTSASQFRHPEDLSVASSLHHWYAYETGRSVPGAIRYFYADICRPDTPARLEHLLRRRDVDAFCLNDHDSAGNDQDALTVVLHAFLERYFPLPSTFERDRPVGADPVRGQSA